jgi:DNA-binding XRE family transcriptional regulator
MDMREWNAESIEAACRKISGIPEGRGWILAAAKILGVSEKTIRNACADTMTPSLKLERALTDALSGVRTLDVEEDLTTEAGAWVVGVPETRTRDESVLHEVVVTHVSTPVFIMHMTVSRDAAPVFRVKWLEEPSTGRRREQLLAAAKTRAVDFANAQARKVAELEAYRGAQVAAGKRGNFDSGDMALLSQLQLAADRRKTEAGTATREGLNAALAQLEKDAERQFEAFLGMQTQEEKRAFRAGEAMGEMKAQLKVGMIARAYSDADLAHFIFAKHVSMQALAHKETARGGVKSAEEMEAERDAAEMAAALAEDLREIEENDL